MKLNELTEGVNREERTYRAIATRTAWQREEGSLKVTGKKPSVR